MRDILDTVDKWLGEGRQIALATVVETWGSAPRAVGAKMGITAEMGMIGSVSGGCVETAVVEKALESIADGRSRLLHYGVTDDVAWDVGLACGGKISVAVEPLDRDWWRVVSEGIRQDRSQVTVTILDGAVSRQKVLLDSEEGIRYTTDSLNDEQRNRLVSVGQLALDTRSSARTTVGDFDVLIDVHRPRPRLVIVGGAHVAMSLVHYAQHLGFGTVLIDPRRAFATAERFPDVDTISYSYPDKALTEEFQLDSETYVAILTHDPKIDDRALQVALSSDVPYIGVLSSKRTHEKRLIRLTEVGVDPALFDRIRTPIGLDISARTPEEIALCIMAEIVAVRNGAAV